MAQRRPHELLLALSSEPVTLHELAADGLHGKCTEANDAACALLGCRREDLLGRTLAELAAPGAAPFAPADAAALRAGEPLTRAVGLRAGDGRVLAVELRCALVDDGPGGDLVVSFLRELAPRQPEDAARLLYLTLLDLAPDAIIVTGDGQRIVFWNKGAEATYGWTREEALGRVPRELLRTRDHAPRLLGSIGAALLERDSWEGEVTHTRKDGREIRVATRWRVHRDAAGRPAGVLGINRDITEQLGVRERQQRLRRLESLGRLAAGIAHDFNNRLAVILSCADELHRALPAGSEELQGLVDDIVVAGAGSKKLMSQLLTFAHERPVAPPPPQLNEVGRRCERGLRETLPAGVELVVRLEPSLWPVVCDPTAVEQALMNLAANARDAMPAGGRLTLASANVELDERLVRTHPFLRRGPHVRLTVGDSGPGMTAEVKAHAFEPFFTTKPQGQGLGLGLATAYGMVKQSGGNILVESEPGRGATFELYFPRAGRPARDAE
jgi:PAS domain S-box-containing protein